jgi:hypothetical protein
VSADGSVKADGAVEVGVVVDADLALGGPRAPSLARDNPFRAQRMDALRYRLAGGLDALLDRLVTLEMRAAVVGPHGSGKTALLAALVPRLQARGYEVAELRLGRGERRIDARTEAWLGLSAPGRVLVLDGSDELALLDRLRVLRASRRASGLLVATHRHGLLPTLHRCRPTPALLAELIAELHAGCPCALPPPRELYTRHRGNLRAALRELYDLHAVAPGGLSTAEPQADSTTAVTAASPRSPAPARAPGS